MSDRTFILADGENLVMRYEDSLKKGATAAGGLFYIPGCIVWHKNFTMTLSVDMVRVSYYTTQVGDDQKLAEARKQIAEYEYLYRSPVGRQYCRGRLCPHVFKKERKRQKTKSVDINLTIDALRHTYNDSLDTLIILAGDGDYIPLIQEVMRQGKRVLIGAFSEGLNPDLMHLADGFLDLDRWTLKRE